MMIARPSNTKNLCLSITERLGLVSASALTVERVLTLWRRDDSQPALAAQPSRAFALVLAVSTVKQLLEREARFPSVSDAVHRLLTCFRQPQHSFAQR